MTVPSSKAAPFAAPLFVVWTSACGAGLYYQQPPAHERHATVDVVVDHQGRVEGELAAQVTIDGKPVSTEQTGDATHSISQSLRAHPGAHVIEVESELRHSELVITPVSPPPGCNPGIGTAFVPGDCGPSAQQRTFATVPLVDARCSQRIKIWLESGESVTIRYNLLPPDQCELGCEVRPGTDGQPTPCDYLSE